jgi:hypothetical protein
MRLSGIHHFSGHPTTIWAFATVFWMRDACVSLPTPDPMSSTVPRIGAD